MKYSIIIPAYNEGKRLGNTLEEAKRILGKDKEILVVDDGSSDDTSLVASKSGVRLIRHEVNRGKGAAVRTGLASAKGDVIGFIDADGSTSFKDVEKVFAAAKDCDLSIASRRIKGAVLPQDQPLARRFAGYLLRLLIRTVLGLGIRDTQCGCKAFRRQALDKVLPKLKADGFEFDIEMLYLARRFGLRVCEIPVTWVDQKESKVNALRDGLRMLKYVIALRMRK
jgi:glycosyltransferase involved in cell wall biosynthesis